MGTFVTFHAIIFENQKSNSESRNAAKNGYWHEIATQGHSRSFTLQSITGQQGVAYRHIRLLALSVKFPKKKPPKLPKIAVVNNPTVRWCPHPEEPPQISAHTLYFQKLHSLAYIFASHWNLCSSSSKRCSFPHKSAYWHGHSRSSKVVNFGTNQKCLCDFLLVHHRDYCPILHRFWDTAKKLPIFTLLSFDVPTSHVPFGILRWR